MHKHLIKVVLFTSRCLLCRCCFHFASLLVYRCCISFSFLAPISLLLCIKLMQSLHSPNLRTNSSLFFFTRHPPRRCQWDMRDGLSHWSWHKLKQDVKSIADKKALCKILLRLDRWRAPVLITTIKHSSKLHHPSLEAEYAWRLTQIPYCEIITQQKILCLGALAGFKVLFFRFFLLARQITCFLFSC